MYNQLREKTGKRYIKKYQNAPGPLEMESLDPSAPVSAMDVLASLPTSTEFQQQNQETLNYNNWNSTLSNLNQTKVELATLNRKDFETHGEYLDERQRLRGLAKQQKQMLEDYGDTKGGMLAKEQYKLDMTDRRAQEAAARDAELREGFGGTADGTLASAVGNFVDGNWKTGVTDLAVAGVKAIDNLAMGDKNFSAQSEAIDGAVHGVSGALMKSGNPYCVCAGTKIYTNSGYKNIEDLSMSDKVLGYADKKAQLLNIEYLFDPHLKECVQIETEGGNILRCSLDHPVLVSREGRARYVTIGKKKQRRIREFNFVDASTIKVGDHVAEIGSIPLFGNHHVKLAYLIGMLIGDGTYGKGKTPRLFTGDPDTWVYLEKNRLGTLLERHIDKRYSSEFRVYQFKGLQPIMRSYGLFGQTKKQKRLPSNLHMWDKESCAALLAGLFDTDGCVSVRGKDSRIIFYQSNLDLLQEVKQLLLKFGIHTYIQHFDAKDKKINNKNIHSGESWGLVISRKDSIINFYNNVTLNISYKQDNLFKIYSYKSGIKGRDTSYEYHNLIADKVKKIIPLGVLPVYNLQVSGPHTYVANNIVTHNCMIAGAALEGANFLTKAGGQTVQGFDVDINSSGYGEIGHMASSSSRDFGAMIGLGGLNRGKMQAKLQKRNQQAMMAMNAANIAEEQTFEQEARMNSIQNTVMNNQIALSGGLETNLLGG